MHLRYQRMHLHVEYSPSHIRFPWAAMGAASSTITHRTPSGEIVSLVVHELQLTTSYETTIFLLFCNLLIIAPIIYRRIHGERQDRQVETTDYLYFTSYWGSAPLQISSLPGDLGDAESQDVKE